MSAKTAAVVSAFAEAQRLGSQYTRRLAADLNAVQPVHWPLLDTVLIDWWYESVERMRWEGEGGR